AKPPYAAGAACRHRPPLGAAAEAEILRRHYEVEPPAIGPGPWVEPVAARKAGYCGVLASEEPVERRRGEHQLGHGARRRQQRRAPPLDKPGIDPAGREIGIADDAREK